MSLTRIFAYFLPSDRAVCVVLGDFCGLLSMQKARASARLKRIVAMVGGRRRRRRPYSLRDHSCLERTQELRWCRLASKELDHTQRLLSDVGCVETELVEDHLRRLKD